MCLHLSATQKYEIKASPLFIRTMTQKITNWVTKNSDAFC